MNEQFNKKLSAHIKSNFQNYDDGMADDGWQKFLEKKKNKKRGFVFWWLIPTGIAAALGFLWLLNIETLKKDDAIKKPELSKTEKKTSPIIVPSKDTLLTDHSSAIVYNKTTQANRITKSIKLEKLETTKNYFNEKKNTNFKKITDYLFAENNQSKNDSLKNEDAIANLNDEAAKFAENKIKEVKINNEDQIGNHLKPQNLPSLATIDDKELMSKPLNGVSKKDKSANNKRFNLGLDANTFVNFSDGGTSNDVNLGLGLITNISINKTISISTGVSINRQTASFEGNRNQVSDNRLFAATSSYDLASVVNEQTINARLIGLDIPLNLKFNFGDAKRKWFLSTGLGSYSLINEQYTNTSQITNYLASGTTNTAIKTVENNPNGKFSSFNFGRTLNLSMGVNYPISKKNNLSVEPFLQYPLSGLGYQNIKIGSGGVSFKFNYRK